jgi:UDP-4-amino-4,6-dideoxy-N-acetyl-beta-L-altrosamine transaminase
MNSRKYSYGKQSISWKDIWEVVKVLRSGWLTQGPKVYEFEKQLCIYTGAKYCVAVSSCTAALHLALLALGIKQKNEVVTSPITFLASANAVLYVGGTVKFADIDESTACIDSKEIETHITSKTKAIIPVHFTGQPCDMKNIYEIAKKYNLFVIEDAAHALGSAYEGGKIGNCAYSDATVLSFHPVKNITTGEGGAITTNNKDVYEKLLMLRTHGVTRDKNFFINNNDGAWYYEQQVLGFNYRITDMQCALGISQLNRLEKFKKRRREIVDLYKREFSEDDRFTFLEEKNYSDTFYHIIPLLVNFDVVKKSKQKIFDELKKEGLFLQVHFIPVHLQPYYKQFGFEKGDFPKAERYYSKAISLPLYYGLKDSDVKCIIKIIKKIVI